MAPLLLVAVMGCGCVARPPASVLLFTGQGASGGDVRAWTGLLEQARIGYDAVSSTEIDAMDVSAMRRYDLLLMPGGNFEQMGKGLSPGTAAKIRGAVQDGLNYLGICAGAFFAGDSPYQGLNLTGGVRFPFYGLELAGIRKAPVWVEVAGAAVARGRVGKGLVVLVGTHPEAPESWRQGMKFETPARVSRAYALELLEVARSVGR